MSMLLSSVTVVLILLPIVTGETIQSALECSVPLCPQKNNNSVSCGIGEVKNCYAYKISHTKQLFCAPTASCALFELCTANLSCLANTSVCITNSCCPRPICMPVVFGVTNCNSTISTTVVTTTTSTRTTGNYITTTTSQKTTIEEVPCAVDKEVHVIGVYEAFSSHFANYHPTRNITINIQRPGKQVLVLSAYEPIQWYIQVGSSTKLNAIHLIGYHEQTVVSPNGNVPNSTLIFSNGACGYSWPYNGQGCDTNKLLSLARTITGSNITSFHGCYQASQWTIGTNFPATSNCATSSGYKQYSFYPSCQTSSTWRLVNFTVTTNSICSGQRYIKFNTKYNLWIGAILCNSTNRYKLYLSNSSKETFLEIADYAGHGQDHCELVNPAFSIPNEDDITSGDCTQCSVGGLIDVIGTYVYARARFGEPFTRTLSSYWADLTTYWYECGISIP